MRFSRTVGVLILATVASFAAATPEASKQTLALATANMEKGRDLLETVRQKKSNAARLDTLDRALYFLRRSRNATTSDGSAGGVLATVRSEASQHLVRALDDAAEIYYNRKSLSLAGKRVAEALTIDPDDARARNLAEMIKAAESRDVYSEVGSVAVQRLRGRRAAVGIPLRGRGIGGRR